ncbi:hypothetical protein [Aestuariivita sp.]|jgi:hypothetical protein|uniref:hypothetical protein n=1 Tax=Aestuariivita sp. TaxID=1872407 RepID=UPI00216D7612|nr:hypothetical protein [Aestuariivita sp.]MCE8007841.1 hypothetical protein [Aestuariivita sp.]
MAKRKPQDAPGEVQDLVRDDSQAQPADAPTMDVAALLGDTIVERIDRPAMTPPNDITVEAEAEGITAWHNGKKITATWCNASNRNAYAAIPGLGWKRLSNANDSTFLSLTMLASHAEQTNATVNVEIGTDNEIHQIYVW